MTAVSVILMVCSILFFILTRETYVYIKYDNGIKLEFHLVIFSLILTEGEKKKDKSQLKFRFYSSLAKRVTKLSKKSFITINKISLDKLSSLHSPNRIVAPYFYHAATSCLLAYFFGNSKRITMKNNALVLISDKNESPLVDIRVASELYNIIIALTEILLDFSKYKKKGKKKNVGN